MGTMRGWQGVQLKVHSTESAYTYRQNVDPWGYTYYTTTTTSITPMYSYGGTVSPMYQIPLSNIHYDLMDILPEVPKPEGKHGALRLWRCWNVAPPYSWDAYFRQPAWVTHTRLYSTATPYEWKWNYGTSHVPPSRTIEHAGFHGFYDPSYVTQNFKSDAKQTCIIGAFLGWGRTVKHSLGARTNFAQIDCIIDTSSTLTNAPKDTVQMYAKKFDVPLIDWVQAAKIAKETLVEFTADMVRKSDEEIAKEIFE